MDLEKAKEARPYSVVTDSVVAKDRAKLADRAIRRFTNRSARVGVVGMGFAGLSLALAFAEAGFKTMGFDTDNGKIASLNAGNSYINHLKSARVANSVLNNRLEPTMDFGALSACDAAIICVPTPLDEHSEPDLSFVIDAVERIGATLHMGQVVVLESTTYPGTTDEVVFPILARRGLQVGSSFFLAFSPERQDPGNYDYGTRNVPRIVGGLTEECGLVAASAYRQIVDRVIRVSSTRIAEAAKLLENTYRCVNIALINELKLLFELMDIDVWQVIDAAATKPFGFTPFYPGPGPGGHCIPIDPFYLSWKGRQHKFSTRLIELAGEINAAMPLHIVERLSESLRLRGRTLQGARILVLGAAYKKNVNDARESPALKVIQLLVRGMAQVKYHDPFVPTLRSHTATIDLQSVQLTEAEVASADAVVIITDHESIDYPLVIRNASLIVDTRNVTARYTASRFNIITA